jgi:hypothetical protein
MIIQRNFFGVGERDVSIPRNLSDAKNRELSIKKKNLIRIQRAQHSEE